MYIPTAFFSQQGFSATGGSEQTFISGGVEYKSHTFTNQVSSETLQVEGLALNTVQVLVVGAGGGAGGYEFPSGTPDYYAAGGGAGQVIYSSSLNLTEGVYTINIGNRGNDSSDASAGSNGGNSSITGSTINITSYGGGGGGAVDGNGRNGGSGGGAGVRKISSNTSPGTAIYGNYGNSGGQESGCSPSFRGGAGGGAGGAGSTNNPGSGYSFTMRTGLTEWVAHGGAPGLGSIPLCSYSTLPTGFSNALGGQGSSGGAFGAIRKGIVIITYPIS